MPKADIRSFPYYYAFMKMFKNRKTKLAPPFGGPGADDEMYYEEKEFYYALGRAISKWADIENNLFLLYQRIINSENRFGMSASYFSIVNFSNKLDMVNKVLRASFYENEMVEKWERLFDRIRSNNIHRNHIAHFSTTFNNLNKSGHTIYLSPSISNINAAIAGKTLSKKFTYNTERLEELVPVFSQLAKDIHLFVIELP